MSEWEEYYLTEIGELARGKSKHRPRWAPDLFGGEYPFIQTGEITSAQKFITSYTNTYSEIGLAQSKLWPENTLCITIAANIAELAILKFPACFPDSVLGFTPNPKKVDLDFVYYTLVLFQKRLKKLAIGSVQDNINLGTFMNIKFPFPSLDEQKEIAKTLSNLDSKISLLRQQNETLEELAQTLFKRWFVDFEFPDENGQPYKSAGGKMIDSELGEIPEGWRVGEVSDFVFHSTKSISPNMEPDKMYSHYSIPAFDNGRYPTKDTGGSILSNKYVVLDNSILVSKLNPSTSRIWTVFKPCANPICSTEIQVFIPNKNTYAFAFGFFHHSSIKREMSQRASGTSSSHQRVRPSDILNIECVVPSEESILKFEETVLGLLKMTEENQEEIQTLTQLRDTLLPKLMSGNLSIQSN